MVQGSLFRGFRDPLAYGKRAIDVAVRRYDPAAIFGLFSGGHDSVCSTHLVAQHPRFTAAVHLNTGIGVEQTRTFVRETCQEQGWPLLEYRAEDEGQRYEDIVLEHGFPGGPRAHTIMYARLKERALRTLVREHKRHRMDRVLLVTGVRKAESSRRMGTVETIQRSGAQVWVAPLAFFTDRHKARYMERHDLPRNEVVDLLHMSGECLCGAFAKPGELEWLEFCGFEDVVARIRRLEEKASERGVHNQWGHRVNGEVDPHQIESRPLCVSCPSRHQPTDEEITDG